MKHCARAGWLSGQRRTVPPRSTPRLYLYMALAALALGMAGCAGGAVCRATETECGGLCTALASDPQNCGACNRMCPPGQLCCLGRCMEHSEKNCGTCGNECAQGTRCKGGQCLPCDEDDRCGPKCAPCGGSKPRCFKSACAECSRHEHCAAGKFCSDKGVCTPCTNDLHCGPTCITCPEGLSCNGQTCITCKTDPECGSGKWCDGGKCKDCNTNDHCGAKCATCTGTALPHCNASGSSCGECGNDNHCPAGKYCSEADTCTACTTPDHCGPLCAKCVGTAMPYCDPSGCAECLNSTQCPKSRRCSAGTCVQCNTDDFCGENCTKCQGTPTPYCNDAGTACVQCRATAHCPSGNWCKDGKCTPCNTADHCGQACTTCSGNTPYCNGAGPTCVQCTDNLHCGQGSGKYCNAGSCVPCTTDAYCGTFCIKCASNLFCNGQACVGCCGPSCAICQPGQWCNGTSCAACNRNDHCGLTCASCSGSTPYCFNGERCVQCLTKSQCPLGYDCDGNACVPCDKAARCGTTCAACKSGETCCSIASGCVNLNNSKDNCGACGKGCSTFCNNSLCDAKVKCSVSLGADIYSTPAVASDGTVYATTTDGKLRAVSKDCVIKWTLSLFHYTSASPMLSNDETVVYVTTTAGPAAVYAINTASGAKQWEFKVSDGWSAYNNGAIGADGTVYAWGVPHFDRAYRESVHALTSTGTQKWRFDLTDGTGSDTRTGGPAVAKDGSVYALGTKGLLHGITSTGLKKWTRDLGCCTNNVAVALGTDGHVYAVTSASNSLYKVNSADGTIIWSKPLGVTITNAAPVVAPDGSVIVALSDGRIRSFASNGNANWVYGPNGCYHSSVAVGSDGSLYAVNGCNGSVKALDSGTGAEFWTLQVADAFASSPSLSKDGILWVGAAKSLWAVTTGAVAGHATTGWPKRFGNRMNQGRP